MTPAPTARDTARRLVARESAAPGTPPDDGAAAERALRALASELTAWFGPFGTHALLTRALAHARAEYPALAGVTLGAPSAPHVDGLADGARLHGAAGAAGPVELIAVVVALLGRLVGDDLATVLLKADARPGAGAPPTRAPHAPPPLGGTPGARAGGNDGAGTLGDTTGSTTDD